MESVSAAPGSTAPKGPESLQSLAVGCFASICRDRLADELLLFSRRCPDIDIGVHEMPRGALLPALRGGDLSLAVLPGGPEPDIQSIGLWQDRVLVAMPAGHRLAASPAVEPSELRDELFLTSQQQFGGDMHRFLAQRILPPGPTLNATIIDLGPPKILDRVAQGDGVALISGSHEDHVSGGIVVRPVEAPGALFPVRAYWIAEEPAEPLAGLIRSLKERSGLFGADAC
ncbi:MAG: LysR family substrate-binding domain-containing protein [Pseudomonadota bacterium]|jgi:DNA-binding transcriptional LysR family regulator